MANFTEGSNPRLVSRGLNLQMVYLGIDSLYLLVEYPHKDVYDFWLAGISDMRLLKRDDGLPYQDVLLRRGALGYEFSVWRGDARLYLTSRVDDTLSNTAQAGQGMGLLLQVGAKWLCQVDYQTLDSLMAAVCDLLGSFHVPAPEKYPMRINRLDVALDVIGLPMQDFSLDVWRGGWVGRASGKHFYDDNKTGNLSGFSIGSSEGAVRFKVYDKVLESQKTGDFLFWFSVWGLSVSILENLESFENLAVTRFEWTMKPYKAKFIGFRYLSDYSFDGLKSLLNYVMMDWGRLCIPQADDNRSRWEVHPIWKALHNLLEETWALEQVGKAKRDYHLDPDLKTAYLNSVTGWLGGLLARVGLYKGYSQPADILEALLLAQAHSKPIHEKASKKWAILSRLAARGNKS